ncbi:Eco57I restriction-modification methylase domain-containing protein [Methanothermococcus sp. SCGC AD-155-M21]|nr:Eco57I restriction-modification methylase domain-containing protein [Methanothermococcus sp. SCGC AD-155-M21]
MELDIGNIIEKELKRYDNDDNEEIEISNKKYTLYVVPELCYEPIGIYEGFLFIKTKDNNEVSYLKKYKSPVSNYAPRLAFILYKDNDNNYLIIKDYRRNKPIVKTLKKINSAFLKKLKNAIKNPTEENLRKLFDRTDVIEEFYILYKKSREYLLKNIKGISEEEKREEFVDNFMMQMLTLWYLQEREFFNKDKNYFITKFRDMYQKKLSNVFNNYYEFLNYLFEKISGYENTRYYEDEHTGKVVVIGPAVFLNGKCNEAITIPDECFYKEGITDTLIDTRPNKVGDEVPLFNLFESRDWTEGNIDEFVLGAIYEKLINHIDRKKLGAYYTPEEITSYICENTIESYLVDKINEKFNKEFKNIDHIINDSNKEIILHLFKELKEIKILDPAVGSAHFLESAINTLLGIYKKIWRKAKGRDKKKKIKIKELNITTTDEKGNIEKINLITIKNEDEFQLLVKFFIILSKNIYGVDINPSAIKVAKARLFLTLAKHFKVGKEKDLFIRFPNVHFNLRVGNSLIGYVDLKKEEGGNQIKLDMFLGGGKVDHITDKINVVKELKPYLEKIAKSLDMEGDILKEIEELNKILSKNEIKWEDFKRILEVKEKLITILIASLNSKYAIPLNELLRDITEIFNQRLDEKFAEEYKIDLEDLKKIKTFHWIFEFPEVFLEREGFDVIVGNPPYLGEKGNKELFNYIQKLNPSIWEGRSNLAYFFVMQSINLIREKAYLSLIIPRYWITADYSKKIRKYIFSENTLIEIVDFEDVNPFPGKPGTNFSIIFVQKKKPIDYKGMLRIKYPKTKTTKEFNYKEVRLEENRLAFPDDVITYIERVSTKLETIFDVNQGIITGADRENKSKNSKGIFVLQESVDDETLLPILKDKKERKFLKRWFKNSEIRRYYLELEDRKKYLIYLNTEIKESEIPKIIRHLSKYKDKLINRREFKNGKRKWYLLHRSRDEDIFISPKIVCPQRSKMNSFSFVPFPFYASADVYFITSKRNKPIELKRLLITLNSQLIYYYLKRSGKLKGEQIELYYTPTKNLPIKLIDGKILHLTDYLLFLNATEERREKLKEVIEFFNNQIADCLVYELYFKEKFSEDGLYPEPKEYLLETISKLLKPINYDRWGELYWKKQLEGNITKDEEKELKKLEEENLKTIEEVYTSIKNNSEVKKWIEKIKSHEWIKVIEDKTE